MIYAVGHETKKIYAAGEYKADVMRQLKEMFSYFEENNEPITMGKKREKVKTTVYPEVIQLSRIENPQMIKL